ncbi:MAG: hypothetical protein CSA65_00055 [Proteobacteria bacterium]|nr:MAG: hypothetical protein CSB49_05085 [Pseudomonadota bacterium]PIE20130.1 MAG: hypothetical protein CSA65_00055 [Pseudomonadota bacterium]
MTEATAANHDRVLYRHKRRPQWGLGVVLWERNGKRALQFEDGEARVFSADFLGMLEAVDPPFDRTEVAFARLDKARGRSEAANRTGQKPVPLPAQIAYFKQTFEEGFEGEPWRKQMRNAKRKLKRHRDPTIEAARSELNQPALDELLEAGDHDGVIEALARVLDKSNLVTSKRVSDLRGLSARRRPRAAKALRELLYGEGTVDERFAELASALDIDSWELVTAPLALLSPLEHVCVRPSTFRQQALWLAPRLKHSARPTAAAYRRYRAMAHELRTKLTEAGLPPTDLLDVHDFIYETLRSSVREEVLEIAANLDALPALNPPPGGGDEEAAATA